MYSSRGIGRQPGGDRRPNDRDRQSYQNSPDIRSDSREKSTKGYNDRRDYRNSPNYDSNHGSHGGPSSRDGYTPPGPPPTPIPSKNEPPPTPNAYAPIPSSAKPSQPNYSSNTDPNYGSNQRQEPNRMSKYPNPAPNYTPTPIYNPTPIQSLPSNSASNHMSTSEVPQGYGGRIDDDEEEEMTPEERVWQQKMTTLFAGVNSIDDMITLKEQYAQKSNHLDAILQKSALREGEILRNKRRNRDDFRDPAMLELRKMQNDIKMKLQEISKFQVEIDKRIRTYQKAMKESMEKVVEDTPDANIDKPHNYEAQLLQNSMITTTHADEDEEEEDDEYEYENQTKEYYDPGSHWCRDCDKMVPKIGEFFEHLHTKDHWTTGGNDLKPWKKPKKPPPPETPYSKMTKIKTAIKGVQFLIPLRGFYCPLCKDYLADNGMAEEHMKGAKHNRIYNRFICLNMDYEHKWNTDKGKALVRHQANERKRIKEEEQKELEKKRKSEEQKHKEEKESKKRMREEELKKRQKEREREEREKEREEYKKSKSNHTSNSSERFRLKDVTLDLKGDKTSSSHREKDRNRERERDKHKKRTRIYSSSDSDSSPAPKIKGYYGDPINLKEPLKDKRLKRSFIKLIPLNRKVAEKYRCKELIKLLEVAKSKPRLQTQTKTEPKIESKTEITIAPNSPLTMDIDMNDDENDNKDLKSFVDGVLDNLNDEELKEDKEKNSISENKVVKPQESENSNSVKEKSEDNSNSCDKPDDKPPDDSFDSESKLEIDVGPTESSNKESAKESDSNDRRSDEKIDSNERNSD